jgi:hypothetical protein
MHYFDGRTGKTLKFDDTVQKGGPGSGVYERSHGARANAAKDYHEWRGPSGAKDTPENRKDFLAQSHAQGQHKGVSAEQLGHTRAWSGEGASSHADAVASATGGKKVSDGDTHYVESSHSNRASANAAGEKAKAELANSGYKEGKSYKISDGGMHVTEFTHPNGHTAEVAVSSGGGGRHSVNTVVKNK